MRTEPTIYTLDLNFLNLPGAIAAYLLPHAHGAALVECGPGSTLPALRQQLAGHGLQLSDITDVFVTHIHLDHAGAAGALAQAGARIHVHPAGAAHLLNPEKLLSSARRIYGELMDYLWGEFLPVPEDRLHIQQDDEVVEIDGLQLQVIETPGHANHHHAYLVQDTCFTGDIGGVRLADKPFLRVPMPPPEFHLETWRLSLERLQGLCKQGAIAYLAPTHFGIYADPAWHLQALHAALDAIEDWIEAVMPGEPSLEDLNAQFLRWEEAQAQMEGMEAALHEKYEAANPSWMAAAGIQRYWRKHRHNPEAASAS